MNHFSFVFRHLRRKSLNRLTFFQNMEKSFSVKVEKSNIEEKLENIKHGPGLKEFLIVGKNFPVVNTNNQLKDNSIPYIDPQEYSGKGRKVYFEVYGCQMNVNDTEIIWSILNKNDYEKCNDVKIADVILIVTCSIREGAEKKIWNRLKHLQAIKNNRSVKKGPLQIGILGCMAERLKTEVLEKEKWVDIVAGPDSYKDLPRLLAVTKNGQSAVNVLLSLDETYADIMPVRLNKDSVTAYVSIMRGCDNMCSYCIVPFTRGRERSRPLSSIEDEVKHLAKNGCREITLLGQNVNSYRFMSNEVKVNKDEKTKLAEGFKTVYKPKIGGIRFAELLECVAETVPEVRIRFTSPHPKDFPDDVLYAIKKYPNICKSIHLPAQSGNTAVLDRMRRGYSRESYIQLVHHIRDLIPEISLSSDFICGFCGETNEEFSDTLTLIEQIKYNIAYLFAYSMREKTTAHRRYKDDVPQNIKIDRLQEMVKVFRKGAEELQSKFVNKQELILIEGKSKRSEEFYYGRNDANIKVIVPNINLPDQNNYRIDENSNEENKKKVLPGDFIAVKIIDSNSQVLKGEPLYKTTLQKYYENYQNL
ncbi:CDK5RAP1-like protein [Condylostylus longicornis]|uniref:CDK5RAP1-like protein n=1 Tax=Condylostylus longicornis TaxID=2530218 RepID=UPI00244E5713|nr:CDK5RAP1-like protein [Condylostylus longicornis]